jgi:phosphoribosylformylglycinamidine synthase
VDLAAELALQHLLVELAGLGLLRSAHDCAEGGLAVCLAESAMGGDHQYLGMEVELPDELPTAALLFGESQGRVVISCAPADVAQVQTLAAQAGVPVRRIGRVGERNGTFVLRTPDISFKTPIRDLAEIYHEAIPRLMHAGTERG